MIILSIDTSCDETAAAVTDGTKVLSNIIWSQASAHAKFGGVMPSLAKRMHEERIDFVINKALVNGKCKMEDLDCIAVTVGPGLSIALAVGVNKAKELALKYNKPLIPVNHIEAHLLSPLAQANKDIKILRYKDTEKNSLRKYPVSSIEFPAYGLVVSGKNTMFVLIKNIGDYEILAQTVDDALGEALDKAARMLGLGYPGGAVLEKMSRSTRLTRSGQARYVLPIPLIGQEKRQIFSYSGLKASLYRLIEANKKDNQNFPSKQDIYDLSASFQDVAFKHITRIMEYGILKMEYLKVNSLLLGGGVSANIELRKRLRRLGANFGFSVHIPYTNKLCGDNAAMIGVCAYLKLKGKKKELKSYMDHSKVDRNPRLKIGDLEK